MKRRYISVDVDKCMGCHTCELACAMAHGSTDDLSVLIRSGEKPGYRIFVESYQATSIPVPCNHCEEAACVLACPTGACHRESEGAPVLVDNDKCIGCRMCVQACPFGMISVHPLGSGVVKCDLCIRRLAQGKIRHVSPPVRQKPFPLRKRKRSIAQNGLKSRNEWRRQKKRRRSNTRINE